MLELFEARPQARHLFTGPAHRTQAVDQLVDPLLHLFHAVADSLLTDADQVVQETGWVVNNVVGTQLTLADAKDAEILLFDLPR